MGIYIRKDSPFFWAHLEGRGSISTGVRRDAPTPLLRKEARQQAEKVYHEKMLARSRVDPDAKPTITMNALIAWYRQHVLPTRRCSEREEAILKILSDPFGARLASDITRQLVTEWMTARARLVQPSTVNREVDVFKAVLQAAVPTYLTASPLYGMKRLRMRTPKRRLLTEEEEARLLPVMDADDRALFLVGLDALVRLGDILDVKKTDDHGRELWIADPKAGGGFAVPLSSRARRAIDAMPVTGSPYLFPRRRVAKTERDRRSGIRQMLERYCALAQPPVPYGRNHGGITFHWATRRTGATRMLTRHVDVGTVQKVGRWKTPGVVLGIYHELIDDKARAAVESVGALTSAAHEAATALLPLRADQARAILRTTEDREQAGSTPPGT